MQDQFYRENMRMIGYTPAENDRRDTLGLPPATGADDPPAWHDGTPGPDLTAAAA